MVVARSRDIFHVEQAVPQIPDLPDGAVLGMPDVQISGGIEMTCLSAVV